MGATDEILVSVTFEVDELVMVRPIAQYQVTEPSAVDELVPQMYLVAAPRAVVAVADGVALISQLYDASEALEPVTPTDRLDEARLKIAYELVLESP